MPAFDSATASIATGRPDCATSWYQCNASIRFFLIFPYALPTNSEPARYPSDTRTAKEGLGECPLREGIAGMSRLQQLKRSVTQWTATGLQSGSPEGSQWAFKLTKGPSRVKVSPLDGGALASCTKVEKHPSGSLRGLCDLVTATRTVLSHFPALRRTCSACSPMRTWGGASRDAAEI